jgi:hypothetical protein
MPGAQWRRKHDLPGSWMKVPRIEYPTTLERLITICETRSPNERLHAAGSHWALSTAAMSDHTHIETHDPTNRMLGMARTLSDHTYIETHDPENGMARRLVDVIPNCMNHKFLEYMSGQTVPTFEQNNSEDTTPYFVHVETGKRIYQLYAELDQPAESDPKGLAAYLYKRFQTKAYYGPWAFRTLGSAGGQTVFGALTTGTHGGDFRSAPIADDVAALHLVADGGKHYWIEPGTPAYEFQLTDDDRLRELYGAELYGGPDNFEIIRDDEVFAAVLVAAGRFGVVYSVVLRAVRQYMLHEQMRLANWQDEPGVPNSGVRSNIASRQSTLYTQPSENRFLAVAVCLTPYSNFSRNLCGVSRRWNVQFDPNTVTPTGRKERVGVQLDAPAGQPPWPVFEFAGNSHAHTHDPDDPNPNSTAAVTFLERACMNADFMIGLLQEVCDEVRKLLDEHKVAAGSAIAAVAVVGGTLGLVALAAALLVILLLLLAIVAAMTASGSGHRLAQVLDDVREELLDREDPAERAAGIFVWQMIAFKLFSKLQANNDHIAISYVVMDTHDYLDLTCNVNVDSIEVFFRADDPMLLAFVDALIAYEIRQEFQGKAFVGYAGLRFTGKTRALIGPQRWDETAVVEIAGLKDTSGVSELVDFAIGLSRDKNFSGILHWGQRNESNVEDIEFRFGDSNDPRNGDLGRWREALATITRNSEGFSSAFTRQTGLEA